MRGSAIRHGTGAQESQDGVRAPRYSQRRPVAEVTEMCFPGNHIAKQNRETVCRAGMSPVEDREDPTPKRYLATPVAVDPQRPPAL